MTASSDPPTPLSSDDGPHTCISSEGIEFVQVQPRHLNLQGEPSGHLMPLPTSDRLRVPFLSRNNCLCLVASLSRSSVYGLGLRGRNDGV